MTKQASKRVYPALGRGGAQNAVRLDAVFLLLVLIILMVGPTSAPAGPGNVDVPMHEGQPELLWSDEFDGPAGSLPDPAKWNMESGAGWTDGELQCYTASPENVSQDGESHLVIQAHQEGGHVCSDQTPTDYTSARITSRYHADGGTLAVRAKLPTGHGTWPAIWALGSNYTTVGWPQCGEMDLVEASGRDPFAVGVHIHGPGYSGGSALGVSHRLSRDVASFHVYSATWTRDQIDFFIDGDHVWGITSGQRPPGSVWALDHSFFAVLNVAVGGGLAGPPDGTTTWPQAMTVDYVRVYR